MLASTRLSTICKPLLPAEKDSTERAVAACDRPLRLVLRQNPPRQLRDMDEDIFDRVTLIARLGHGRQPSGGPFRRPAATGVGRSVSGYHWRTGAGAMKVILFLPPYLLTYLMRVLMSASASAPVAAW